jgi:AcrR family transcriptional regulator
MKPSERRMCKVIEEQKGFVSAIARELKISRTTFYAYLESMPAAKQRLMDVREARHDFVEGKMLEQIENGNTAMIIFYLKTQARERGYVERQEHTGPDGGGLNIIITERREGD